MHTEVILHNIRSAHNVGAIFRTADGVGVSKIYLTGHTPTPTDRFGRVQGEILKTALGATETIPHEYHEDIHKLIAELKQKGRQIVVVEQLPGARDYRDFTPERDTVFIFGNEVSGVEESISTLSDVCIEVPMRGKKESLNVSVCVGVILFHFLHT